MNEEVYLRQVLRRYLVSQDEIKKKQTTAVKIYPLIRRWANHTIGVTRPDGSSCPGPACLRIRPVGSIAKKTCIRGGTDVDLFISLNHKTAGTLSDIYTSLYECLISFGYTARQQNVSIRVKYCGIDIDLVPGKRQSGQTSDHSLYKRKTQGWTKTNVSKHILYVLNKKRHKEIRLLKVWRNLHNVEFPSFYLELSVIEALRGCKSAKLADNMRKVFRYLTNELSDVKIVDPANTNNIVSDDLSANEKKALAEAAESAVQFDHSWELLIW